MKKKQYNEPIVEVMRVCTQEMMIIEGGTTGVLPPGPAQEPAPERKLDLF